MSTRLAERFGRLFFVACVWILVCCIAVVSGCSRTQRLPAPPATPLPADTPSAPTVSVSPPQVATPIPQSAGVASTGPSIILPPLPQIRLNNDGRSSVPGTLGTYNWPTQALANGVVGWTVSDAIPPNPSFAIEVLSGETLSVEVNAFDHPVSIEARVFGFDPAEPLNWLQGGPLEKIALDPGPVSALTIAMPEGTYMIDISGTWKYSFGSHVSSNLSAHFAFKVEVN